VLYDDRIVARTTSRPRNLKKNNQHYVASKRKNQFNQHYFCQAATETNIECEFGRGQDRDNKCCQIPIIINRRIGSPHVNVSSKIVKGRKYGNSSKTMSDHKVLIYGDSHTWGLSVRLKINYPANLR
jgi:hypothetical protein